MTDNIFLAGLINDDCCEECGKVLAPFEILYCGECIADFERNKVLKFGLEQQKHIETIERSEKWKYPEKNEYPKNKQKVICVYEVATGTNQCTDYYFEEYKDDFKEHYIAWCELPVFNKADKLSATTEV